MTGTNARLQVLRMVEQGRLSAAEGARLLAALGGDAARPAGRSPSAPRWLRIRVAAAGGSEPRADVTVPYALARALAQLLDRLVPQGVPEIDAIADAVGEAVATGFRGTVLSTTDRRGDRIEIVVE